MSVLADMAWGHVDGLSFRAYYDKGVKLLGSKSWTDPLPLFRKLWWKGEDR